MRGSARLHQGLRTPKSHRNPWAAAFRAPLALLDFEAVQPPVPRSPGCGPYTHIPVQLSCHTLAAGGYRPSRVARRRPGRPSP